jgi:flagella basal body P-ring formation protein FlgA
MRQILSALLLASVALPATAATLRTQVTLSASEVRLSDLFDEAGAEALRVLGPGPAPGGRIVVEARQLAAIARQFGVDWRPVSGAERTVLDRPGRMLPREDVLTALRGALQGLGADTEADIELQAYPAPLLPPDGHPQVSIEQIDQDGAGRFTAQIAVLADGMDIQRLRLTGTVVKMIELPVPVRRLTPGSLIQPDDLRFARIRSSQVRGDVVQTIAQAVGQSVRTQAMAGQPLPAADIMRPLAVVKGATVIMQLTAPGLQVLGQGRALEPGSIGDRILVLNPGSKAVVEAEIVGRDRVRVAPGSSPVQQPGTQQVAVR